MWSGQAADGAVVRRWACPKGRSKVDESDPLDPAAVHDCESFLAFVRALAADREAAVEAEQRNPSDPGLLGLVPDAGG